MYMYLCIGLRLIVWCDCLNNGSSGKKNERWKHFVGRLAMTLTETFWWSLLLPGSDHFFCNGLHVRKRGPLKRTDKFFNGKATLWALLTLLHSNFCREYDSQERSASEVKQEIERHLKDKETLENSLPSSIVIGPYWISTEGVRQALAKKRKALANAVIELLAKKLRKQADMVGYIHLSLFSLGNSFLVITYLFVKEPMLTCFFF